MKPALKSLIIVAVLVCISILSIFCIFYFQKNPPHNSRIIQGSPNGRAIEVISFNLVMSAQHDRRVPDNDCFSLEYVSSAAADPHSREREALEVFELIRPISEQWGFTKATLAAFKSVTRKGRYDLFVFRQAPAGKWSFIRYPSGVLIND